MRTTPTNPHYDPTTILLHWLTAALVVSLWLLGQTIDWFAKGNPRVYARSTHITLGVLLAVVLVARIIWRSRQGVHLPNAGLGRLDDLARLTHRLLYALLTATAALGIANAWVRGDKIFDLFRIPALAASNDGLREIVGSWHGWAANTLLALAGFHAVAALLHHFYWKDGVLRRMLPLR